MRKRVCVLGAIDTKIINQTMARLLRPLKVSGERRAPALVRQYLPGEVEDKKGKEDPVAASNSEIVREMLVRHWSGNI